MLSMASAYAIAPLRPATHMTNYCFLLIEVDVLVRLTSHVTIPILQKRAKFKITIVYTMAPTLTFYVGWSKALTPIPRNMNTSVSAE